MFNLKKACLICLICAWRAVWGSVLAVFLLGAGIVLWLAYQPVPLDRIAPYVEGYLAERLPFSIGFERIYLTFDERPILQADGVRIRTAENGELVARVNTASMSISKRWLLLGQVRPVSLAADGFTTSLQRTPEGVFLGEIPLWQPQVLPRAAKFEPVRWLNHWRQNPGIWRQLERLELKNLNLALADLTRQTDWTLRDANLTLEQSQQQVIGERLVLTADVVQAGMATPVPVRIEASHAENATTADVIVRLEDINSELAAAYLPAKYMDRFQAQGSLGIDMQWQQDKGWQEQNLLLDLADVTINAPELYAYPVSFTSVQLKGQRYQDADRMVIESLTARDADGVVWQASGALNGLEQPENQVQLDIQLRTDSDLSLAQVKHYLPEQELDKIAKWLNEKVRSGESDFLEIRFAGDPGVFPHCRKTCGLELDGRVKTAEVRFLENTAYANANGADFNIRRDVLTVNIPNGTWAGQATTNTIIKLGNMFTPPEEDVHLAVSGTAQGQLAPLLAELQKVPEIESIPQAQGQQQARLSIKMPIKPGDIPTPIEEMQFDIASTVRNLRYAVPELANRTYSAPRATFKLVGQQVTLQTQSGQLDTIPLAIDYTSDLKAPDTSPVLKLEGEYPLAEAPASEMLQAAGSLPFKATLDFVDADQFDIDLTADATQASLTLPQLNWQKPRQQALSIQAAGRLNTQASQPALDIKTLALNGEGIKAQGRISNALSDNRTLSFQPFQLGEHDLDVLTLTPQKLEVKGQTFDGRGIDLFAESDVVPAAIDINVANYLLPKNKLTKLEADFQQQDDIWQQGSFMAYIDGKGLFANIKPHENGKREVTISIEDTGLTMAGLGLHQGFAGGRLTGKMMLDDKNLGTGHIIVQNLRLVEVPLMARLLATLTLDPLLDLKQGLLFREVDIPLGFEPDGIALERGALKGPSMDMYLDGKYTYDSKVNIDGRLIPANTLNRLISDIPLVGSLLTGSQEGLLVADFKIKGAATDPDISVQPLSLITPGLLKDIFRGLTGDQK